MEEVGVYALGAKLGLIVRVFFVMPFMMAWQPFFFSALNDKNGIERIQSGIILYSLGGMLLVLIISLYAINVIKIIAPPSFEKAFKTKGN